MKTAGNSCWDSVFTGSEKVRIEVQARDVWRKECGRRFFSFKERAKRFWIESFMAFYNAGGVKLTTPIIISLTPF